MINNRITEGVGKKIVDALKKQNDLELSSDFGSSHSEDEPILVSETMPAFEFIDDSNKQAVENNKTFEPIDNSVTSQPLNLNIQQENTLSNFADTQQKTITTPLNDFDNFELPANVEVLRQLITKIPSNVSKQTGAQIIKQTMEALGISMKGVLQEAQLAQENLNTSVRECQNEIAEHKRQISVLESQTHKLHKQYSVLNDIISLFIQAGN